MPSRTTNARIAALATTLVAGVLAAFALRPSTSSTGSAAHVQQQAAEVRTQVIRRTVHIVRHERPPRARTTAGRGAAGSTVALGAAANESRATNRRERLALERRGSRDRGGRTAHTHERCEHRRHTVAPARLAAPVRTRTSGTSAAGAPSTSGAGAPVRTRAERRREEWRQRRRAPARAAATAGEATMTERRTGSGHGDVQPPAQPAFGGRGLGGELSCRAGPAHRARRERHRPGAARERIELGGRLASGSHGRAHHGERPGDRASRTQGAGVEAGGAQPATVVTRTSGGFAGGGERDE